MALALELGVGSLEACGHHTGLWCPLEEDTTKWCPLETEEVPRNWCPVEEGRTCGLNATFNIWLRSTGFQNLYSNKVKYSSKFNLQVLISNVVLSLNFSHLHRTKLGIQGVT